MATLYEKEGSSAQPKLYQAGEMFIVTRGEYDDYGIEGRYKVCRDFYPVPAYKAFVRKNLKETLQNFTGAGGDLSQAVYSRDMEENFLKSLVNDGIIAPVETHILHMGGYGDIEIHTSHDYYKAVVLNPATPEAEAEDDQYFDRVFWAKRDLKEL